MANEKPRLKIKYEKEVLPELQKTLGIKNKMAVPNLTKIIINSGLGEAKTDNTAIEEMVRDIALISGQKPMITKSKKAISNFKIRKGMDIGVKVTLRKDMMWYFLDRLVSVALPRVKDFRGVPVNAFDGQGNYALGLKEHTIFPEVDATKVSKIRGLQVIICTSADNNDQAKSLLSLLGMPFQKV
ncbi:MAG TPA: 50S ribosomal protein L5 [Candidatus Dojkabacteria bacterium]|nr:50S ribosomal protein L5 [Candidatus Dojkabacteria bacterium]HRO64616.1 50S ribosomal protein L5 [Candidatus Dojkabacteria bacterium]HRP36448.1 50S ribosomal protein L5 [Candidatus Dojkabacteria bacterium]HRP51423.1 50S ribosomal protein L5 [Candidatus Dojkabacteria bacterium]